MKRGIVSKKGFTIYCPTCGSRAGERCELNSGQPRTDAHPYRELSEKLQTEKDPAKFQELVEEINRLLSAYEKKSVEVQNVTGMCP